MALPPEEINSEEVLWSGTVSHWHYRNKWLLICALLVALVVSFLIDISHAPQIIWPLRGALVIVILFLVFWISIDRSRRKYLVSNKRVVVEFGIIARSSNEVRVQDIRSINLMKSGIPGALGIGRVEFSSAATDDADVVFWNCPDAQKVRDLVRSLQA